MRIWVGDWAGGDLVEESEAAVSPMDHGFTVADGVFETLKVLPAGAFAVSRHLRRLAASAAVLGLEPPELDVVRSAVDSVVAANVGESDQLARLRITYTGGSGPLGSERGSSLPTLVVAMAAAKPWPPTTTIATVPWTRNEKSAVAGVKTTSYAENVVALRYAHDRGASEAILGNTRGELCEGTGSNIFVVVDGRVLTPSLDSGCLAGITRELVIAWFGADEVDLSLEALATADEVFITSSTRNVHPVVRADDREWSLPGPVSRDLQASFDAEAARDLDP